MLVLSRKEGESLQIDDRIQVTVVRVQGGRVTIGIEAPKSIPVVRSELCGQQDVESSDSEHR